MDDKIKLELSDLLSYCELDLKEAQYVAKTVHNTFCPLFNESNDPRKGAAFISEMAIAMGIVCERMNHALEHMENALKIANS